MNNIVIVSDDKSVSDTLKSYLMLLRKFDIVFSCDLLSASETVCQNKPQLIIYYSKNINENCLNFIKSVEPAPVFFVTENLDDEKLLEVYELGAADYISISCSQTEFLIKVMMCLRKYSEIKKGIVYGDILKRIGILNKNNEFYSKKYTPAVLKNLLKKYISEKTIVSLMSIAPDINDKNKCNLDFLASVLNQNLREDDLIGFGKNCLYVMLPNTNQQGALDVYNKIKKILEASSPISAGVVVINKDIDFNLITKKLDEALDDALSLKNSVVVQENLSSEVPMNWLDKPDKKHKTFKLFKKAVMKKLENVIAPIFYQKQQIAEQRLFETRIEQYVNEKKSIFSIKKGDIHSFVEITYPGSVRININIYNNFNENKEPEHKNYELSQINQKVVGDILDKLIRDFQRADK